MLRLVSSFAKVVDDEGKVVGSAVSTAKTKSIAVAFDGKVRDWTGESIESKLKRTSSKRSSGILRRSNVQRGIF